MGTLYQSARNDFFYEKPRTSAFSVTLEGIHLLYNFTPAIRRRNHYRHWNFEFSFFPLSLSLPRSPAPKEFSPIYCGFPQRFTSSCVSVCTPPNRHQRALYSVYIIWILPLTQNEINTRATYFLSPMYLIVLYTGPTLSMYNQTKQPPPRGEGEIRSSTKPRILLTTIHPVPSSKETHNQRDREKNE